MKKLLIILSLGLLLISSCTSKKSFQTNVNTTIVAEPYGIADKDEKQLDTVVYKISAGNVFWAVIFSETIIVPIYFVGWDIYQPVRLKNEKDLQTSRYLKK